MIASAVGSMLSLIVLVAFAPALSQFAIRIGAQEYASLTLAALMLVVILSQAALVKGILSAPLGTGIATAGSPPTGATPRLSSGFIDLMDGGGIVPLHFEY